MKTRTPWPLLLTALLAAALVQGCDDDDDGGLPDGDDGNATPGVSQLRLIHASPDAPALDVYRAGSTTPLFTNLVYGQVTSYADVEEGAASLELRTAGADPSSTPVLFTAPLPLTRDTRITAVATGRVGSTNADDRLRVLTLVEGFEPVAQGTARVRVVHAAPDAPTVALDVGNDGAVEIPSLVRFADTGAAGLELPAGQPQQLGVSAGMPPSQVTSFSLPALPAGQDVFVLAVGLLSRDPDEEGGFSLLVVGPEGLVVQLRQNPSVYVLHAAVDAPAVDLFAGQTELVDDLAFGALSGTLQVAPGTYVVDVFPHTPGPQRPQSAPVASIPTPSLVAGERYLGIATGFLAATGTQPPLQLLVLEDDFASDTDSARVRLVHASPDTPAVDVGTVTSAGFTPVPEWTGLTFGQSSSATGVELPAGSLRVGAALAGSGVPVLTFDLLLVNGTQAFAVAIGSLASNSLQLKVVDTNTTPWSGADLMPSQ